MAELSSMAVDVARIEGSMRELATLNQMFSSQVGQAQSSNSSCDNSLWHDLGPRGRM